MKVKKQGWINIYRNYGEDNGGRFGGSVFATKEEAISCNGQHLAYGEWYISTTKIKWEEEV